MPEVYASAEVDRVYMHRASGRVYKVLMHSTAVAALEPHVVYQDLETGKVFNRSLTTFLNVFDPGFEDKNG